MQDKENERKAAPTVASAVEPLVLALVECYEDGRAPPRIVQTRTIVTGLGTVTICQNAASLPEAAELLRLIRKTPLLAEAVRDEGSYDRLLTLLQKWKVIVCFLAVGKILAWWELEFPASADVFAAQRELRLKNQTIV